MAMVIDGTLKVSAKISGTIKQTSATGDADASASPSMEDVLSIVNGTADGTADRVILITGTLAAGIDAEIDVVAGLTDVFGNTITMADVVAIFLHNDSDDQDPATTAEIRLGGGTDGAGTNAFDTWVVSAAGAGAGDGSEAVRVPAGACVLIANAKSGFAAVAGSDILRVLNADGAQNAHYRLMLVGRSA